MSEFRNLIEEEKLKIEQSSESQEDLQTIIKHKDIEVSKYVTELLVDDLKSHSTRLKVYRDDNEIVKLEFICKCGERTMIDVVNNENIDH